MNAQITITLSPSTGYTRPHICIFCHYPIIPETEVRLPAARPQHIAFRKISFAAFAHRGCLPTTWQEAAHA